ncbi:MAG TPA: cobalt transporter [Rhodospirillales bacterium]|nr:cobalt transporter [Rhodospirillales bacterium]
MLTRIILSALLAGLIGGVVSFGTSMWKTTPIIVHAEVYEDPAAAPTATEDKVWAPKNGFERNAYTFLSGLVTTIGFAFLLVGAIALSGRDVDWKKGLLWGLAAFGAIFAWPSLGLAPEPPGLVAADLAARQIWWLGTVASAAVALVLLFLVRGALWKGVGVILLAVPHIIGAPGVVVEAGRVPAELASEFASASLILTALTFLVLGAMSGHFYRKFEHLG